MDSKAWRWVAIGEALVLTTLIVGIFFALVPLPNGQPLADQANQTLELLNEETNADFWACRQRLEQLLDAGSH